jgi:threonine/homoserine/homoserine lactone efflux protein
MDEVRAFLFGATLAAAIGPIALLIVHTGARNGLRPALAGAAGVATADFVYALAAFAAGSGIAGLLEKEQRVFSLAASAVLVAIGIWFAMDTVRAPSNPAQTSNARRFGFSRTFLLTLANPLTIVLFAGFSGQLALSTRWTEALYFAALIFSGSLPVQACYALFGALLHKLAPGSTAIRALNIASAMGIVLFGLYGLARVL